MEPRHREQLACHFLLSLCSRVPDRVYGSRDESDRPAPGGPPTLAGEMAVDSDRTPQRDKC